MAHEPTYTDEENDNIRHAFWWLMYVRGWKQDKAAKILGSSQQMISHFLGGKGGAGTQLAEAIAKQLSVTAERLAGGWDPAADVPGGRLRALRRRLGLNVIELAPKLGVTKGVIWRYETSEVMPPRGFMESFSSLIRLAESADLIAYLAGEHDLEGIMYLIENGATASGSTLELMPTSSLPALQATIESFNRRNASQANTIDIDSALRGALTVAHELKDADLVRAVLKAEELVLSDEEVKRASPVWLNAAAHVRRRSMPRTVAGFIQGLTVETTSQRRFGYESGRRANEKEYSQYERLSDTLAEKLGYVKFIAEEIQRLTNDGEDITDMLSQLQAQLAEFRSKPPLPPLTDEDPF